MIKPKDGCYNHLLKQNAWLFIKQKLKPYDIEDHDKLGCTEEKCRR